MRVDIIQSTEDPGQTKGRGRTNFLSALSWATPAPAPSGVDPTESWAFGSRPGLHWPPASQDFRFGPEPHGQPSRAPSLHVAGDGTVVQPARASLGEPRLKRPPCLAPPRPPPSPHSHPSASYRLPPPNVPVVSPLCDLRWAFLRGAFPRTAHTPTYSSRQG